MKTLELGENILDGIIVPGDGTHRIEVLAADTEELYQQAQTSRNEDVRTLLTGTGKIQFWQCLHKEPKSD